MPSMGNQESVQAAQKQLRETLEYLGVAEQKIELIIAKAGESVRIATNMMYVARLLLPNRAGLSFLPPSSMTPTLSSAWESSNRVV